MAKLPTIKDLAFVVIAVKSQVPYAKAHDAKDYICEEGELPTIDLTIGWDSETGDWSYQTGDNSFTGGAYGYPIWATTSVSKRANSREVARYLQGQLDEQTWG